MVKMKIGEQAALASVVRALYAFINRKRKRKVALAAEMAYISACLQCHLRQQHNVSRGRRKVAYVCICQSLAAVTEASGVGGAIYGEAKSMLWA